MNDNSLSLGTMLDVVGDLAPTLIEVKMGKITKVDAAAKAFALLDQHGVTTGQIAQFLTQHSGVLQKLAGLAGIG